MAAATKTSGRQQASATPAAQLKTPNLSHYYRHFAKRELPLSDVQFHLDLLVQPSYKDAPNDPMPKDLSVISIDHMVDSFNWIDEQSTLTGSLTLHRPDPANPFTLPIMRNQLVRCRATWNGRTYELWTMKTEPPQDELDTNTLTVALKDDMALLDTGSEDWIFRATKRRPHGYFADEIAIEVARTLGLRVGTIAKGIKRMSLTKKNVSGLAMIKAAYDEERKASGRVGFVIRMRNGKLEVVPLKYNPDLYVLSKEIQTALLTQKSGAKLPVTVLKGTGHVGSGKHVRKLKHTAYSREVVRAYGWVESTKDYGLVKSHADLRNRVKRDLAKGLQFNDTISITHAGIPFVERGDTVQVYLPVERYKGQPSFVWVTRVEHDVQAGTYSMAVDFNSVDPIVAQFNANQRANKTSTSNSTVLSGSGQRWAVTASQESLGGTGSCGHAIVADGYSELSTVPQGTSSDFHALGGLPCGTVLIITNPANGRSVQAAKQDVGAGSSFLPVMGLYPGTTAALGLSGGEYHVIIQRADGGPLQPVRGTPA